MFCDFKGQPDIDEILSEIAVAGQLIEGVTMEDFINDERTARAISMTLINIGELMKNLTPELKEENEWDKNRIAIRIPKGREEYLTHKGIKMTKERIDAFDVLCGELSLA